jgi:hypothetical protein
MKRKQILFVVPAALFILCNGAASAGQTINESGALAQFVDKWNESEPNKGHKLADFAGRCVIIPDDPAVPKATCSCVGNYEYMPDGSWKGAGTCTDTYQGGDSTTYTWEEGSHLKEYKYTYTGGTGKYQGAGGEGTYTYNNLTDTLQGGRYQGRIVLP